MTKNILTAMFFITSIVLAQDEQDVDAIEKARQAKEAAEKAAAEASAATEAAIEAAAQKAAKEARESAKKEEEEEARKLAEAKAAEEAELDAAATAAAEEAKRKMKLKNLVLIMKAQKNNSTDTDEESVVSDTTNEEFVAKEPLGFNVGLAASLGLIKGESFSGGLPTGATVVIGTPIGFKIGPFDYTVSLGFGGYSASSENEDGSTTSFNPSFAGIGGNLIVSKVIFAEGHLGLIGEGTGFRGFAGISLEKVMNKSLNLPVNLLIGSEAFYSTDMAGSGNPSGGAALGFRF